MEAGTLTPSLEDAYEFVGGPYDGRRLAVSPPPEDGIELVVHSVGQPVPAEFYVLGPDHRFHHTSATEFPVSPSSR